jgi:uncharacterized protein YyaL (SSP411 family)
MKLDDAYKAVRERRGPTYRPRTRHLDAAGWARYTNRLFLESSPYLLQHAHNPVDWYPWGDEAFAAAKALDRPVLLSVGYATCHWCHIMEEESFEDEEIAACINDNYIAVKVDREEHPEVDAIYMAAVQAIAGRGGWPMTVILTPERKPFYGGTYFPARDGERGTMVGFLTLLKKIKESYDQQRSLVLQSAEELSNALQSMLRPQAGDGLPDTGAIANAVALYKRLFDYAEGGTTGAPKFPSSLPVRLLMRVVHRGDDPALGEMVRLTLDKMAGGGIFDQVGGGFHRYATDARWGIPHFEKMLYDNALLVVAYLEGYQLFSEPRYKQVVQETLAYVQREMTDPAGGFYSAGDADSIGPSGHREEGYFFTWTPEELTAVLGPERAALMGSYYGVTDSGNFEGRTVLHRPRPPAQVAEAFGIRLAELQEQVHEARTQLYTARSLRPAPLCDDKILTAWNGLMISAFARAGLVLGQAAYVDQARQAVRFIHDHCRVEGRLMRSFREGRAAHPGYLEDYAFFTAGLLDLFEATGEHTYLQAAMEWDGVLECDFEDHRHGGFFMTAGIHTGLIAREKPFHDGALPSGNAVAVMNLLRLWQLTGRESYHRRATQALAAFSGAIQHNPSGLAEMLLAVDFASDAPCRVIIVTPPDQPLAAEPFLAELNGRFIPNRVLVVTRRGAAGHQLAEIAPFVADKLHGPTETAAYFCRGDTCPDPARNPAQFGALLHEAGLP